MLHVKLNLKVKFLNFTYPKNKLFIFRFENHEMFFKQNTCLQNNEWERVVWQYDPLVFAVSATPWDPERSFAATLNRPPKGECPCRINNKVGFLEIRFQDVFLNWLPKGSNPELSLWDLKRWVTLIKYNQICWLYFDWK